MSTAVPLSALLGGLASALIGFLFAGADTALTSLSATRLSALEEQSKGWMKSAFARIQRDNPDLRSRYLLGRVASTALTSVFVYQIFEPTWAKWAIYFSLAITVAVTSVLFEVSTTLARKYADFAAPAAARYLRPLEIATIPFAVPLSWLGAKLSATRDGETPSVDPRVTEAEVEHLVDEGEKSGRIAPEPAEMIRNVLDFADRTARDVMISRDKVQAIELTTPIEEVLSLVAEGGHSRYPVYRGRIDDVVGLLYSKDLFKAFEAGGTKMRALAELVRGPANFVAESRPLSSLLREMRRRRRHLAIVVDELGAVSGIVTLEDVLEEIVGDIRDEHDDKPIEDLGDGRIVADATMSIQDLQTYLGHDIAIDEDYDSIGAMMMQELGGKLPLAEGAPRARVPAVGEEVTKFGFKFVVRDSDESAIGKVMIEPATPETSVATVD